MLSSARDEMDGDGDGDDNDNDEEGGSDEITDEMPDEFASLPDFTLIKNPNPDISDIPADAFVTEEDTKGLKRAHRRADRIIQYADDVTLIASFHYKVRHCIVFITNVFVCTDDIVVAEEEFPPSQASRAYIYRWQ
jgi:hypothetical protein